MKTIETIVEVGDDHILRAPTTLEKGAYRAVIVIEDKPISASAEQNQAQPRVRKFGTAKGKIWMADDFDETPEDFKDYM